MNHLIDNLEDCLDNIYVLESEGQHREASKIIFRFIESNFSIEDFETVNTFIETIDLKKLSPLTISGLLRFTSRTRYHLPYWQTIFNQAKEILINKGYKFHNLLVGIEK